MAMKITFDLDDKANALEVFDIINRKYGLTVDKDGNFIEDRLQSDSLVGLWKNLTYELRCFIDSKSSKIEKR